MGVSIRLHFLHPRGSHTFVTSSPLHCFRLHSRCPFDDNQRRTLSRKEKLMDLQGCLPSLHGSDLPNQRCSDVITSGGEKIPRYSRQAWCEREASTVLSASSMISMAVSISLSLIDSGGAMRKQFNIPAVERTMFIDKPRRRHSLPTATPSSSAGSFVVRSSTSSRPTSNPLPRTSPICS